MSEIDKRWLNCAHWGKCEAEAKIRQLEADKAHWKSCAEEVTRLYGMEKEEIDQIIQILKEKARDGEEQENN